MIFFILIFCVQTIFVCYVLVMLNYSNDHFWSRLKDFFLILNRWKKYSPHSYHKKYKKLIVILLITSWAIGRWYHTPKGRLWKAKPRHSKFLITFSFFYFLLLTFLKLLADDFELRDITFDTSYLDISVGAIPSCFTHTKLDIPNNFELHPGNYVFYDRKQL